MAATTTATAVFTASKQRVPVGNNGSATSLVLGNNMLGSPLREHPLTRSRAISIRDRQVRATAAVVETSPKEETKEFVLPTWAEFELGVAPVFWKTMNGCPPTAGERLRIFYNPAAAKLEPSEDFGIAFNGGFNQPIMCGGEPRGMLKKERGKVDPPIYSIQICIPKHAMNLIFSFTNGSEWDGPYRLQFQIPKTLQNKPLEFFNEVTVTAQVCPAYAIVEHLSLVVYMFQHIESHETVRSLITYNSKCRLKLRKLI